MDELNSYTSFYIVPQRSKGGFNKIYLCKMFASKLLLATVVVVAVASASRLPLHQNFDEEDLFSIPDGVFRPVPSARSRRQVQGRFTVNSDDGKTSGAVVPLLNKEDSSENYIGEDHKNKLQPAASGLALDNINSLTVTRKNALGFGDKLTGAGGLEKFDSPSIISDWEPTSVLSLSQII